MVGVARFLASSLAGVQQDGARVNDCTVIDPAFVSRELNRRHIYSLPGADARGWIAALRIPR
jgi:hypothetical protein